jgi:hypothetical protein
MAGAAPRLSIEELLAVLRRRVVDADGGRLRRRQRELIEVQRRELGSYPIFFIPLVILLGARRDRVFALVRQAGAVKASFASRLAT